jgi:predicted transcriptional regulator
MPKLTVEFNERMNEMLEALAAKEDTTKVDIIRRALALYKYVEEEVRENERRRLAIAEGDKVVKEIVLR